MPNKQKIYSDYTSILADVPSHATLMVGGFGLCGIPEGLINRLAAMPIHHLTCISNNAGVDDFGLGLLLKNQQIQTMIASYVGENALFEQQMLRGELKVELTPQGTLAEKIRAGGAGIPAFFTPAGFGTPIATGKETRQFGDKYYVLEEALSADFALIKAYQGDAMGNLVYRKTAANFNPMMATAGKITIAEVEEIVPVGTLDPDHIQTPGIYVNRIIQGVFEKRVEQRTVREVI